MEDSQVDIGVALRNVCEQIANVTGQHFLVTSARGPLVHTRMQVMFNLKFTSAIERMIYENIITHAVAAERISPGGFDRCIELLVSGLVGHRAVSEASSRVIEVPESMVATSPVLRDIVARHVAAANGTIGHVVWEALSLAGFGGRIIVEKTPSMTTSVELVRGYTFNMQRLLPIDVSFVRPRVFCIDGFIEEVSEVHHLLEAASDAKEPCIMFVRGASDDVKHTLKLNYDRGSLRVLPIGVMFDLEGMNTLIDMSIVVGCDLVSSLKGDLISSIKFHDAPRVEQVTAFNGQVVIVHGDTRDRVSAHVAELRTRREAEQIADKGTLLDKRIKSLSPNHVVIRLPNDKDFVVNSQAIDHALRAVKSAVSYGVTAGDHLTATETASRVHADRCVRTLRDLGCYVSQVA